MLVVKEVSLMGFSQRNLSKICEILAMNGDIVATGRISGFTDGKIKITNNVGEMALLKSGMKVKFLVHSGEPSGEIFVATVLKSTRGELYLSNIGLLSNLEKREYFRVSVNMHTKCYIDDGSEELDERKSFKVKVRDLSLRGVLIKTCAELEDNQRIFIVLPLPKAEIFKCKVKRKIDDHKCLGCGCEFERYSGRQEDLLCQYIFEEQRKMLSRAKRYE
ncbi:MAG: PilZ domain-containing protein [Clostridia bacterium]|nr:PilZ domain-containing protein [Clostridia bacterium]